MMESERIPLIRIEVCIIIHYFLIIRLYIYQTRLNTVILDQKNAYLLYDVVSVSRVSSQCTTWHDLQTCV